MYNLKEIEKPLSFMCSELSFAGHTFWSL